MNLILRIFSSGIIVILGVFLSWQGFTLSSPQWWVIILLTAIYGLIEYIGGAMTIKQVLDAGLNQQHRT
jgi:hypothetical protein